MLTELNHIENQEERDTRRGEMVKAMILKMDRMNFNQYLEHRDEIQQTRRFAVSNKVFPITDEMENPRSIGGYDSARGLVSSLPEP